MYRGVKSAMMRKVKITPNTNGDSRVATHVPTYTEFREANDSHITEVSAMMKSFADELELQGQRHDWTKKCEPYCSMFYRNLCSTIEGSIDFFDGEWSKLHYTELERHHLNQHVPDDVNLLDVIEMLCDCVCAGAARSKDTNSIYDISIPSDVLTKAVENTVNMLKNSVYIQEES